MTRTNTNNQRAISLSSSTQKEALQDLSFQLQGLREEYLAPLRALETYRNFNFNSFQPDPRAVKPNGVFRAYLLIARQEGREPTIAELSQAYNERYGTHFQKRAVRDCVRLINSKRPSGMSRILLSSEKKSGIYNIMVIDSLVEVLSRGESLSSRKILGELRKEYPGIRLTPSGLRRYLRLVRNAGIPVTLKHGELTSEIVRESFILLREKLGRSPSIGQLVRHLQKVHGISTSPDAAASMLRLVRNSRPNAERQQWLASRPRKIDDSQLLRAYRKVKSELQERGLSRAPALSDVMAFLSKRLGADMPSYNHMYRVFKDINLERRKSGKPSLKFVRKAFPHLDRVEAATVALRNSLGRGPTVSEIREFLIKERKNKEPLLSESQIGKALRTINRSGRRNIASLISKRCRTNVYDEDIVDAYKSFLSRHGDKPSRAELWKTILNKDRKINISFAGFDYRIRALRKRGVAIEFRGSPKSSSEQRRAAREEALVRKRDALVKTIIETELKRFYGSKVPAHIRAQIQFLSECVEIAIGSRLEWAAGVSEVRSILRAQERLRKVPQSKRARSK